MANIALKDITFPGLSNVYEIPEVDNTLSEAGAAADAKKTGDELGALKEDITELQVEVGDASMYTLGLYPQISVADVAVASFDGGADDIPVKSMTVEIEPVQSGSGDPSPSNVRPISGWTGANVSVTGKNLLAKPFDHAGNVPKTLSDCFFIKAGTYIFSFDTITATNWRTGIIMMDAEGNYLSDDAYKPEQYLSWNVANSCWLQGANNTSKTLNITIVKDCYIRIIFAIGDTTTSTTVTGAQLELGSTATAYEPYKGNTYAVDWTTEAGTVYGGTLDVTNGVLTVDKASVDLGSLDYTYNDVYFNAAVSGIKDPTTASDRNKGILSSMYKPSSVTELNANMDDKSMLHAYGGIFIRDTSYSDATVFKTAVTGQKLVYELATPQTIQLTPTEVNTILGQNNIWANTGDISELTYRADLKAYIDSKLNES